MNSFLERPNHHGLSVRAWLRAQVQERGGEFGWQIQFVYLSRHKKYLINWKFHTHELPVFKIGRVYVTDLFQWSGTEQIEHCQKRHDFRPTPWHYVSAHSFLVPYSPAWFHLWYRHPEIFPVCFLFPSHSRKHDNRLPVSEMTVWKFDRNSGSLNASSECGIYCPFE